MSTPAPRRHGNSSPGDILRTIVVFGVIILGVWVIAQFVYGREPDDLVPTVDHERAIADARQAAEQRLFAPKELPDGWRANGARFEPTGQQEWHLGVVTDDDRYIGLDQAKRSVAKMLNAYAYGGAAKGTVTINGVQWQRRSSAVGTVAFVAEIDDTVVVVNGDAPASEVEDYVESLDAS